MKQRDLVKMLKRAGFKLKRHGGNHDTYQRGSDFENVPRHREIDEMTARGIIKKWGLK